MRIVEYVFRGIVIACVMFLAVAKMQGPSYLEPLDRAPFTKSEVQYLKDLSVVSPRYHNELVDHTSGRKDAVLVGHELCKYLNQYTPKTVVLALYRANGNDKISNREYVYTVEAARKNICPNAKGQKWIDL